MLQYEERQSAALNLAKPPNTGFVLNHKMAVLVCGMEEKLLTVSQAVVS